MNFQPIIKINTKKNSANIFVNITKIQRSIQSRHYEKHKMLTK